MYTFKKVNLFPQKLVMNNSVKEKDPNIVELDSENYGAPPENSGIAAYKKGVKSPDASYTEPQAWEDEE